MSDTNSQTITVTATVQAAPDKVWQLWTEPEHITRWNHASDDWHSPRAENDVRTGGRFSIRMETKDGSQGFDFAGTYDRVEPPRHLSYTMDDGRWVEISFTAAGDGTAIAETFVPETTFPVDHQQSGWQAILDNFRAYAEAV